MSNKVFRPSSFSDFVGQETAKEMLSIEIQAAKKTGDRPRHIGLIGGPGLGKTNLAEIIANEIGGKFHYINGTIINNPKSLFKELRKCKNNRMNVFLIDEVHALPKNMQENLLSLLEEPSVLCFQESNGDIKKWQLPENVVFILATTNIGLLGDALESRLSIIELVDYNDKEKEEICRQVFEKSGMMFDDIACKLVAKRGRSARYVKKHAQTLMNYAKVKCDDYISEECAIKTYEMLQIDEYGMEERERRYVKYLLENAPVSARNACKFLNIERQDLEHKIERFLIRQGWLKVASKGRSLTDKAKRLFGEINDND